MMKKSLTTVIQIVSLCFLVMAYNNFTKCLPVAVKITENVVMTEIKSDLTSLQAPRGKVPELANAVYTAHQSTGLNSKLITAVMYTESKFNEKAMGPENRTNIRYKGLMQTPTATWFSDVDTLHGARILVSKLEVSNHDLRLALALYKGGKNPVAFRQADEVLRLYYKLQKRNA